MNKGSKVEIAKPAFHVVSSHCHFIVISISIVTVVVVSDVAPAVVVVPPAVVVVPPAVVVAPPTVVVAPPTVVAVPPIVVVVPPTVVVVSEVEGINSITEARYCTRVVLATNRQCSAALA